MTSIVPSSAFDQKADVWPYFFVVDNIKGMYADWRKFKDFVRSLLSNDGQPGWVSIKPPTSFSPTGYYGSFSVKKYEDAVSTFDGLVRLRQEDSTYLKVHWFDSSTSGFYLRACNCYSLGLASYGYCAHWQRSVMYSNKAPSVVAQVYQSPVPSAASYTQSAAPASIPAATGVQALTQSFSNVQVTGTPYTQPVYTQSQYATTAQHVPYYQTAWYAQQQQLVSTPTHVRGPDGLSVNVSKGAIRTESRGVHISNLDYKVTQAELEKLLSRVAKPIRVDLHMDSSKGKSNKGSAIAQFRTSEEAKKVISHFNHFMVKGKELRVRQDKNAVSVETTAPTIINGSTGYSATEC